MLKNDGRIMEGSRAWVWCGPWNNSSNYFTIILPYCNNNNKAWDADATCFSCCLGPKISCILHCLTQVEPPPSLSTSSCYIAHSFFSQKYRCIRQSTIIPISSGLHMSFPMFYNSK